MTRLMRKQNLPIKRLATTGSLATVAEELKYQNLEALYVAVGEGARLPAVDRRARLPPRDRRHRRGTRRRGSARPAGEDRPRRRHLEGVVVRGARRLGASPAAVPVPGDEILGFVTKGQGVSVHRTDCPNVASLRKQPSG